jgi:hypothetical protein
VASLVVSSAAWTVADAEALADPEAAGDGGTRVLPGLCAQPAASKQQATARPRPCRTISDRLICAHLRRQFSPAMKTLQRRAWLCPSEALDGTALEARIAAGPPTAAEIFRRCPRRPASAAGDEVLRQVLMSVTG